MLHIITGPPLSGKSTFVRNNAKLGDVIIDLDEIARAITVSDTSHDYPLHIRQLAIKARQTLINTVMSLDLRSLEVWLIHAEPSAIQMNQYLRKGAQIHKQNITYEQLAERIKTRPDINKAKINAYYSKRLHQSIQNSD
jgi:predicted kinase